MKNNIVDTKLNKDISCENRKGNCNDKAIKTDNENIDNLVDNLSNANNFKQEKKNEEEKDVILDSLMEIQRMKQLHQEENIKYHQ